MHYKIGGIIYSDTRLTAVIVCHICISFVKDCATLLFHFRDVFKKVRNLCHIHNWSFSNSLLVQYWNLHTHGNCTV